MRRNYNGEVNRNVLRDLKRLCNVKAENSKKLLEVFEENGTVSFYTNLDFFGCPDELSEIITLNSTQEITEYLKKDFAERLEGYLSYKRPAKDYLLSSLIEYLKENGGVYPDKDKLRQLERDAEAKRISNLPAGTANVAPINPNQAILREILELSEEIMEARRETSPSDIAVRVKPYPESLWIETEHFQGNIIHERYYGNGNSSDYRCAFCIKNDRTVRHIEFVYGYDHGYDCQTVRCSAQKWFDEEFHGTITERIITIHKEIVKMAREMGIEFFDEVKDYSKISIKV